MHTNSYTVNSNILEVSPCSVGSRGWSHSGGGSYFPAESKGLKVYINRVLLEKLVAAIEWVSIFGSNDQITLQELTYSLYETEGFYDFGAPLGLELDVNLKLYSSGQVYIEFVNEDSWAPYIWADLGNVRDLLGLLQ